MTRVNSRPRPNQTLRETLGIYQRENHKLRDENQRLIKREMINDWHIKERLALNIRLIEALEYLANPDNYLGKSDDVMASIAQKALEPKKEAK